MNINDVKLRLYRFRQYNEQRLNAYKGSLDDSQARLIDTIAMLFHINPAFTASYNNDCPCGIKNFDVLDIEIEAALKVLRPDYTLNEDEKSNHCIIEGLYLQECLKTGENLLWIVFDNDLGYDDMNLLNRKAIHIENLLKKNKNKITLFLTSIGNIEKQFYQYFDRSYHIDKKFLIEEFYAESIVLAGKIPAWWLLDSNNKASIEPEHENHYLHIDDSNSLRVRDYYSAVIWHLLGVTKNPISTWLELLLILHRLTCQDEQASFSSQIRSLVQKGHFEASCSDINRTYADYIKNIVDSLGIEDRLIANSRFFSMLASQYQVKGKKTVFYYFSSARRNKYSPAMQQPITLSQHIEFISKVYKLTENIFLRIKRIISDKDEYIFNEINELEFVSESLLLRLKRSYNNFHMLPEVSKEVIYQERVIIKLHSSNGNENKWLLYSEKEIDGAPLKQSDNIIELLSWAYINQIIDTSTRIASICPASIISAIDMLNIVKFLADNTKMHLFNTADLNPFTSIAYPVKSLIFVNNYSDKSQGNEPSICQLNIFNTGEYHVSPYRDYDEFIACIHGWFYSARKDGNTVPDIKVMGVKPGESVKAGDSIKDLVHITGEMLDKIPTKDNRIIFKKNDTYYVSHAKKGNVETSAFTGLLDLYKYLEHPLEAFTKTVFINVFEQSPMLEYLLNQNKENIIQLFYLIEGNRIQTFVFDDRGSLFTYNQLYFKRQCYINNWMLFIQNALDHLSSDTAVKINQLLKIDAFTYEHVLLNGNLLPSNEECYSLDLCIEKVNNNIEITFEHDSKLFKSKEKVSNIYTDIYKLISSSLSLTDNVPVYLSDIRIDESITEMKSNGCLCLIDYLNYKRNVEYRLNKKINGLV